MTTSMHTKKQSLGSGVIVSPDGYILTANHVVAGADEIKVAIADTAKKNITAKVIGTDPPTDVAVLKIDAKDLPAITLGDSDQLEVGDVVLAIGNPFGIGQTVTMGIVSALGRSGLARASTNMKISSRPTRPSIPAIPAARSWTPKAGSSASTPPSLPAAAATRASDFAVPINLARHVMERLINGGKVTRGYLGIFPEDITPGLAEEFNLPDQNGALVGDVARHARAKGRHQIRRRHR